MTDEQKKDIDKLMADFCKRMISYGCDAVQIVSSSFDSSSCSTETRHYGLGNWYARKGMVTEFIETDKARTHSYVEHTEFQIPDDSDDDWKGD